MVQVSPSGVPQTMSSGVGKVPSSLGFFGRLRLIFSHPTNLFRQIRAESTGSGVRFLLQVLALGIVVLFIIHTVAPSLIGIKQDSYLSQPFPFLLLIIGIAILHFLVAFIRAGLIHIVIRWFQGTGGYSATYNVIAHGDVPTILLGWLPLELGILSNIYSLLVRITGYSIVHQIPWWKGLVVELVVDILVFGAVIALALIIAFIIGVLGGGA